MQSARNNAAIPIPERQKRVGPHVCAGTNVLPEGPPNLTHPQLAEADYDPTGDSLLLDNGFWELFELEYATDLPPIALHNIANTGVEGPKRGAFCPARIPS
jgi:hypothetical protein